jgi:hypothetical protein
VEQKLVRFLNSGSGIAANQKIDIGHANGFWELRPPISVEVLERISAQL